MIACTSRSGHSWSRWELEEYDTEPVLFIASRKAHRQSRECVWCGLHQRAPLSEEGDEAEPELRVATPCPSTYDERDDNGILIHIWMCQRGHGHEGEHGPSDG